MSNAASDIKNQVLSDYLILKREAIKQYTNDYHWDGLNKLKTLISGIPLSVENYKRADKIINAIEKIEDDANKITGADAESTASNIDGFRNLLAEKLFDSTLRDITRILQNQGYFEYIPQGSSSFYDPSQNRKSFSRKP